MTETARAVRIKDSDPPARGRTGREVATTSGPRHASRNVWTVRHYGYQQYPRFVRIRA